MLNLLKGERAYLKRVERQDLEKRLQWINDPDVQATLNYTNWPVSLEQNNKWFDKVSTDMTRRDFSVFTLDGDEYIGSGGLMKIEYPVMKAELYVMIGDKQYWRGGYGTDAYIILVNYGFCELGLKRIYGYQHVDNHGAHRVVNKLGWQREGLLRQDIFSHGKIKDRYIVSILFEEWEQYANRYGMENYHKLDKAEHSISPKEIPSAG